MNDVSVFVLVAWALAVIYFDVSSRKIPNYLNFGAIFAAILVLMATGQSVMQQSALSSIIGFLIALLITVPSYAFKLLGGGDVKLLCAIALLCGVNFMLMSFVIASISILFVINAWYFVAIRFPSMMAKAPITRAPKEKYIPYGASLAIGLILAISFHSQLAQFDII